MCSAIAAARQFASATVPRRAPRVRVNGRRAVTITSAAAVALMLTVLIAAPVASGADRSPSHQPMAGYDAFATREHPLGPGVGLLVGAPDEQVAASSAGGGRDALSTASHTASDHTPTDHTHKVAAPSADGDTSLNAVWAFARDQLVCRLERGVPKFGVLRIIGVADGAQLIELQLEGAVTRGPVDVVTRALTPPGVEATTSRIGSIELLDAAPTRVGGPLVEALLAALRAGKWVGVAATGVAATGVAGTGVAGTGVAGTGVAAPIALSGDNFAAAFAAYRTCLIRDLAQQPTQQAIELKAAQSPSALRSAVIHFAIDRSTITAADARRLKRVVADGEQHQRGARFVVDGHTDSTGSLHHNEALAAARAAAVSAYLRTHGIARARVASRGHAYRLPVASNKTSRGRALNRRATVRLVKAASAQAKAPTASAKPAPRVGNAT